MRRVSAPGSAVEEKSRTEGIPGARILAVVVLYRMSLEKSHTIQGLFESFASYPELHKSISVLVWDNSPSPLGDPQSLSPFTYRHSTENLGVSGAYNRAMKMAEAKDCQWLLLLDQDTAIPAGFLAKMLDFGCRFLHRPEIAAVVPYLADGDRILSPLQVLFKRSQPLTPPFEGIYPGEVSAANSGTLIRIDALQQIGGFNEDFWLDFSDVAVFHLLHRQGKKTYIAGDLLLKHNNSAIGFSNSMSPQRYANFIAAEGAYWDSYGTIATRAFHTLRTLERAMRQTRRPDKSPYAGITRSYFFRRLFSGRRSRLRWWKRQSGRREMPS